MIPGSMATPGFVVRGKGKPESLDSASHGAGRRMSRTAAREKYRWKQDELLRNPVEYLSYVSAALVFLVSLPLALAFATFS